MLWDCASAAGSPAAAARVAGATMATQIKWLHSDSVMCFLMLVAQATLQ